MLRTYRRTALTAAALLASTALLTACQGGEDDTTDKSQGSASSSEVSNDKSGGGDESRGAATDAETQSGGEGVNGTWFGSVTYLAPSKYLVDDLKDTKQAFHVTTSTNIQGAGTICGDADGQAAQKCTEDELATAAKNGVQATVKVKNGNAVSIVEDHSSNSGGGDSGGGEGVNGTWFGNVTYLAPSKYLVDDLKDTKQAFHVTTSTNIQGAGTICGDADGQAAQKCTEDELATAAKNGVQATVKVKNGNAVSIVEDHS